MPFKRPTLKELVNQGLQDITSAGLSGLQGVLSNSVLGVINSVLAGQSWLHFSYLDWISKQAVPFTSTDEYLAAWGALKNVFRKAPTPAYGTASFAVSTNEIIPKGTQISRPDGTLYISTDDSITTNGITIVPVQAVNGGAVTNYMADQILTLSSPVSGVQSTGKVYDNLIGGSDIESEEDFRTRVINSFQATGTAGREQDYINWALAVDGVNRAWVSRNGFGVGTVVLYIMLDQANAVNNGFPVGNDGVASLENRWTPATGDQLRVANALWDKQPIIAMVVVCAPKPMPVDFTISDLGSANTQSNRDSIKATLDSTLKRLASPGGTIYPSAWNEALAYVATLPRFTVADPVAPVIAPIGSLPVLGTITFQS